MVTARRRDESQQDVPISISSLSGETLIQKGVTDFIELSRQTPNAIIAGASTNPQLLTIGIRGIRQKEGHLYFENSASIIYNQSVIAHPYGVGEMMYDLSDVQILKGPQGTLFGRNSTAGALVVSPRLADPDAGFTGTVTASLGSYKLRRLTGAINLPLAEGLAFRIAAEHREREGYVTNIINGDTWNGINNDSFRASLTYEGDGFRNYLSGDWFDQSSSPAAIITVDFLAGGSGALVGGVANANRLVAEQRARGPWRMASEFGTNSAFDLFRPERCAPGSPTPLQTECHRGDIYDSYSLTVWGINNRTEIDIGENAVLKNIISYRAHKRRTFQSSWNTATVTPGVLSGAGNHSFTGSPDWVEVFTEELNLSGSAFQNRLDYSVGAFYMDDRGLESNRSFQVFGLGGNAANNLSVQPGDIKIRAYGIYGQATYAVTDRLNVTGGLRYNNDRKSAVAGNYTINLATGGVTCSLFEGSVRFAGVIDTCVLRDTETLDAITWTASVDYKLADRTLGYVSVSRGYRSGSFFPRAIRTSLFAYDPEYVTSYEVGLKSDWELGTVPIRTNLAVYRADVNDMQVQVADITTQPLSGFIDNAANARYQGGEFEVTIRPTSQFTLSGFASYTDFKFLDYLDNNGADLSYQTAPNPISPWVVGGSAEYSIPLPGDSSLDLRADLTWTDQQVTDNRLPNIKGDWAQPAYTILNMRADWRDIFDTGLTAGVWVTNLTNDFYSNGGTCLTGVCVVVPSAPRMWGFDLSVNF